MRSPLVIGLAAALLALGSGLAWFAPALDESVVQAFHARYGGLLAHVARDVTALGSHALVLALMLATTAIATAGRQPRLAIAALVQGFGAVALSFVIKVIVQRPRPTIEGLDALLTYAFPSGHSVLAAAAWPWLGALLAEREPSARARAWYVGIGLAIAVLVGVSRMVLGVHRPSEVIAGLGLGLGWGWLCARWARPVGADRL